MAPKTKYSIILDREAETILVVTMNISELQPLITCKVLLTSPAVRAGDEQPAVKSGFCRIYKCFLFLFCISSSFQREAHTHTHTKRQLSFALFCASQFCLILNSLRCEKGNNTRHGWSLGCFCCWCCEKQQQQQQQKKHSNATISIMLVSLLLLLQCLVNFV